MKIFQWVVYIIIPFIVNAQVKEDTHKCFTFNRYNKKIISTLNEFNTRIYTTSNSTIVLPESIVCKNVDYVELFKQGVIEGSMFYKLDLEPNLDKGSCKDNLIFAKKEYGISIENVEMLSNSVNGSHLWFRVTIVDPSRFNKYFVFDIEVVNNTGYPADRFDLFCKNAHISCMKFIKIEEPY